MTDDDNITAIVMDNDNGGCVVTMMIKTNDDRDEPREDETV